MVHKNPQKRFTLPTFEFFHITALKALLGLDYVSITPIEGKSRRGLALFESTEKLPALKDFKVIYQNNDKNKEIDLQAFSVLFKDIKQDIFRIIDNIKPEEQKNVATETKTAESIEGGKRKQEKIQTV